MTQGIQVYDAFSNLIFDASSVGTAKHMGEFITTSTSGSYRPPASLDGQPIKTLFAYSIPRSPIQTVSLTSLGPTMATIYCKDGVVYWTGYAAGTRIAYGDGYA